MTNDEVERHAEHLCDVYPIDEDVEHIGVIEEIVWLREFRTYHVLVSGHPEYGPRWFCSEDLTTSCKVRD